MLRNRSRLVQGFDRLAPFYDLLARAVFGASLDRAQSCFLDRIPAQAAVLVVGGGTGAFLERLLADTSSRTVDYVEISPGMLGRSRDRIRRNRPADLGRVRFLLGDLEVVPAASRYQVICTHCFLDLFTDETLGTVLEILRTRLAPDGIWYDSDFRLSNGRARAALSRGLVALMYRFFALVCSIEARRLPAFDAAFDLAGLDTTADRRFYGGMIRSRLLAPRNARIGYEVGSMAMSAPATHVGAGDA